MESVVHSSHKIKSAVVLGPWCVSEGEHRVVSFSLHIFKKNVMPKAWR